MITDEERKKQLAIINKKYRKYSYLEVPNLNPQEVKRCDECGRDIYIFPCLLCSLNKNNLECQGKYL